MSKIVELNPFSGGGINIPHIMGYLSPLLQAKQLPSFSTISPVLLQAGLALFSTALFVSQRVGLAIFLPYVVLAHFLTVIRKHYDIESWNLPFNTGGQKFSRHSSRSPRKRRFSDGLYLVSLHSLFLIHVSLHSPCLGEKQSGYNSRI
jgi:hypothetical protein